METFKYIRYAFLSCLVMSAFLFTLSSCEEEDGVPLEEPNGKPEIRYVRVTNPDAADSLLVKANLGQGIAIVGENLGGTREIWFNDRQATISPSWVTNQTILVNVPNIPPVDITDKLYLLGSDGDTLLAHPFVVQIAPPQIDRLKSEWIPVGADLVIEGNYFFEPLTVTLPGGEAAEIVSIEQQTLRVKVPEAVGSGPIEVETNFGSTQSSQLYKDNRGIFGTMEPDEYDGNLWHKSSWFSSEEETPEVPNINGYYIRINETISGGWEEWFVGNQSEDPNNLNVINTHTQNIPGDAFANPSDYELKFEMFTVNPTDASEGWYFYIGTGSMSSRRTASADGGTIAYEWLPGEIDTGGEWETMAIPFQEIMKNNDSGPSPIGYGFSFFWWNFEGDLVVDCAIDNIRIVPKD